LCTLISFQVPRVIVDRGGARVTVDVARIVVNNGGARARV
jgi:hypothetical protein